MTDEERQLLQDTVDDVYQSFISDILKARNIDKSLLKKYADGRVLTGKKAKELGFIDEIGDFYDVVEDLKKRIGIPDAELYFYEEDKNPLTTIVSSATYIKNLFGNSDGYQLYYLNDKLTY
jgi:protease-4